MRIFALEELCERALNLIEGSTVAELGDLSVSSLARRVGVSVSYLCRSFKKTVCLSPHSFIRAEKMARAAQVLRSGMKVTVNDVANGLNFCHTNYFITCFKTHWGVTPGSYREL